MIEDKLLMMRKIREFYFENLIKLNKDDIITRKEKFIIALGIRKNEAWARSQGYHLVDKW